MRINQAGNRKAMAIIIFIVFEATFTLAQDRLVDFRYAPQNYLTAICLPDDWQKTLVTETGALAYDLGPGPYAKALTEVSIGIKGKNLQVIRQYFADPRIPIVTTEYSADGISIKASAFALVQEKGEPSANIFLNGKVQRIGGLNGCIGWAVPSTNVDPAFRNVAWGTNRPIKYRVKVAPGSRKQVAIGVIEPYKPKSGMRDLELRVEGATPQRVDPMKDGKNNLPYVYLFQAKDEDRDGWLALESHTPIDGSDPNTTLSVFWVFPEGQNLSTDALIRGELSAQAEVYWDCGREHELQTAPPRFDALHALFAGNDFTPTIRLKSRRNFEFDHNAGILRADGRPFVMTNPKPVNVFQESHEWILELPSGTKEVSVVVQTGRAPSSQIVVPDLRAELKTACEFWLKRTTIPLGKIIVPDSNIQYVLDANIRNLYQIHEMIDGEPQFQPGPSVYRGLWTHDAVWHNSAALMLGDTANVERALESMMRYQQPDGQVKVIAPLLMNRETVCLVYMLCRYARMAGDKAWLEQHWWRITRGMEWLRKLREQTLDDPNSISYGLFPPGFADGGLGGLNPEYGSVYWALIGTKAAAEAAHWLGKDKEAATWRDLYAEMMISFRHAVRRDLRKDRGGNWYLPMKVADTSRATPPQQANWGILDAQGLGNLFALDDSIVVGTLNMLQWEKKEGLPINTGWLKDGVWTFFGTLQAIAHVCQHDYQRSADLLYAIANHASPLGTWVEEQLPKDIGTRTTGDQSNATASSLFIKLVRRLLVLERGNALELLGGVPDEWFKPGAKIELNDIPTLFGRLQFHLNISADGKLCRIHLRPVGNSKDEGGPILFLGALKRLGYRTMDGALLPDEQKLPWGQEARLTFKRKL